MDMAYHSAIQPGGRFWFGSAMVAVRSREIDGERANFDVNHVVARRVSTAPDSDALPTYLITYFPTKRLSLCPVRSIANRAEACSECRLASDRHELERARVSAAV